MEGLHGAALGTVADLDAAAVGDDRAIDGSRNGDHRGPAGVDTETERDFRRGHNSAIIPENLIRRAIHYDGTPAITDGGFTATGRAQGSRPVPARAAVRKRIRANLELCYSRAS